MLPRQLPPDLVAVLRRARELEDAASSRVQLGCAIAATTRMLLACQHAGWRTFELADAVGLTSKAANKRVHDGRRRGLAAAAVDIPPPARPRRKRTDIWSVPVERREWLTVGEAAAFAGVARSTVARWRRRGMLPNTDWSHATQPLYLRADLLRLTRQPPRNAGGLGPSAGGSGADSPSVT